MVMRKSKDWKVLHWSWWKSQPSVHFLLIIFFNIFICICWYIHTVYYVCIGLFSLTAPLSNIAIIYHLPFLLFATQFLMLRCTNKVWLTDWFKVAINDVYKKKTSEDIWKGGGLCLPQCELLSSEDTCQPLSLQLPNTQECRSWRTHTLKGRQCQHLEQMETHR